MNLDLVRRMEKGFERLEDGGSYFFFLSSFFFSPFVPHFPQDIA